MMLINFFHNLWWWKVEGIKDRVIRDIRNHFEHEEDYCKSVREDKFWSKNYGSNCNRNKTLLIGEYFLKIEYI